MRISRTFPKQQQGAILIVALLMLLTISLLTLSSVRSSKIGLHMAQNDESRIVAEQAAQALSDFVIASSAATPVMGGNGFSICTPNEGGCTRNDLPVVDANLAQAIAADHLSGRVERMNPAFRPPPRALGSSIDKFTSASFRITATYDRADEALGRQQVVEGVLILVPAF